ncbi:MAG: flippase-like domain-containing protein [Silicimonas sp.]|nr:flippase-like domain-containing protein [Silicimonas sp.]
MNSEPNSPRVNSAAASSPRRWRDLALLGGLFLLVVIGLVGLALATGWEETVDAITSLSMTELAVLLALSLVNYVFRGLRWHLFALKLGLNTSLVQNMRHFLAGFAMSVTPGRVGELVRMRWIRRETGWSFERTAPLVLVDRAADLAAMAILLALAVALSATGVKGGAPVAILALAAAFVATRPQLLSAVAGIGHLTTGRRFPRIFARVRRAALSLRAFTGPTTLVLAGFLGVLGWMAEGYAFYLLLDWLGADIAFWMAMGIFIFATLAGGLTGAPGGLGGAEAAMLALLVLNGVPIAIAAPATLVIRVTTLWFAIGIGLLVFPAAERSSKRAHHVEEV